MEGKERQADLNAKLKLEEEEKLNGYSNSFLNAINLLDDRLNELNHATYGLMKLNANLEKTILLLKYLDEKISIIERAFIKSNIEEI